MYCFVLLGIFALTLAYKPARYYVLSYFFSQLYTVLYNRPRIAQFLGIRYVNVEEWKTDRKNTRIFSMGIFVKLLKLITGMDLRVSKQTINSMMGLQRQHSRQLNMERYFDEITNKSINLVEFEHFLSRVLLIETNNVYRIVTPEQEKILLDNIVIVFEVLNGLSGGMVDGIGQMLKYWRELYAVSRVLRCLPEAQRLLIFGPQLSLVTNFTKMIVRKKGIIKDLQPCDFLDLLTKFFVFDTWENGYHELVFAKRENRDMRNTIDNKAFGAGKVMCPGARMTIDYIQSILSFLQSFDITFEGEPVIEGGRFKNITNKDRVKVLFTRTTA